MKGITVKEAIEQDFWKAGNDVWVKGQVSAFDKDNRPLGVKFKGLYTEWISEDNEIYLPTAPAPEAEPKLEEGQYWHHPKDGDEWLVGKKTQGGYFVCECTKECGAWAFSEIESWDLDEFNDCGYVLGRHPDNIEAEAEWLTLAECKPGVGDVLEWGNNSHGNYFIKVSRLEGKYMHGFYQGGFDSKECYWEIEDSDKEFRVKSRAAQPEQWQPKEGELVWNKVYKNKAKIVIGQKGHIYYMFFDKVGIECISPNFERDREQFEPYANQDAKIDFSVAGQWVINDSNFVLITTGETDELAFYGINPKNGKRCMFRSDLFNWQLLTPEQMQPILEAYENLKLKA